MPLYEFIFKQLFYATNHYLRILYYFHTCSLQKFIFYVQFISQLHTNLIGLSNVPNGSIRFNICQHIAQWIRASKYFLLCIWQFQPVQCHFVKFNSIIIKLLINNVIKKGKLQKPFMNQNLKTDVIGVIKKIIYNH